MADKKISELTAAGALTGAELVEIVQGGVNKQSTTQAIANLAPAGGTSIPFGSTSGTNTYTIAATPAVTAYANGDLFLIKVVNGSTNLSTFNFDSVGAKKAYATPEEQISDGYLEDGRYYLFTYDAALDGAVGGFLQVNESNHSVVNMVGNWDASGNTLPSTTGSGPSGVVKHGDAFVITVGGTVGGVVLSNKDWIIAMVDNPGNTIGNWLVIAGLLSTDIKLALKASLASPTFTGTPAAPTAAAGTSTTQIATTAFVQTELGFSFVSITGAVTLDSTAFGKMHICTGTVSAYTIALPTAVGNANKSIAFKGDADGLTVNVTIDGNSGETIDDEDSRQFNAGGLFVILSDGANWHIVAEVGSWVTYTPVWTGLSADPVMSEAKYWRTGKNCIVQFRSGTDGTSNATTKTITFPFNAYSVVQFASITSVRNNGTTQTGPGYLQTRANSNVVDLFRDAQSLAWTASGGFRASGTVTYQVE